MKAGKQDSVTDIITEADVKAGNITTSGNSHTWKFEADSVTDFVFATSNHYIWKAASLVVDPKTGRRTRVDAAFNPSIKIICGSKLRPQNGGGHELQIPEMALPLPARNRF
jgi:hypothetical protein